MTSLLVEQKLADQLASQDQQVELRSADGKLLGHFVPATERDEEIWERVRAAFTDEDVQRALNSKETGGRTWPEIHADLEAKWPST